MKRSCLLVTLALLATACQDQNPISPRDEAQFSTSPASDLTPKEALGKAIYFDMRLSLNNNQSCATCHDPDFGFTGPLAGINLRGSVYMGSVGNAFGDRRPPSAAYATQAPVLYFDAADEVWIGGNFWDGRATGQVTGIPAGDQALGPFLNPVEQALPDKICVLYRIAEGPYADLWESVWGEDLSGMGFPTGLDKACRGKGAVPDYGPIEGEVDAAYLRVGLSIAAFEASTEVNAFSSKFDAVMAGVATFTEEEALGQELFNGDAKCNLCHISQGTDPLFTDYTYDNLGTPKNPLNPIYETNLAFVDLGIGEDLGEISLYGAVKVPTLRNVAKAPGRAPKSFGHNGVFKSLEQIVHFYNTRDVLRRCEPGEVLPNAGGLARMGFDPECWPAPEYPENVNTEELGDLGLTLEQERALVAFMKTLSDGWGGR